MRDKRKYSSFDYAIGAVVGGIVATGLLIEALYVKDNAPWGILVCGSIPIFGVALYSALKAWEMWRDEDDS